MLAYVFWHWPQPVIARGAYEEHLREFQQTLAANKSSGFQQSVVFRIRGASWLNTSEEAYEEWYLLDDSAAMDPHNKVAREAADGTGGLYRLRDGVEDLDEAKFAIWVSKPAGVSYKTFYAD